MHISEHGIKVLHYFESCRLEAYPDPGSRDGRPWTIGWGHTGPEVCKGLTWTQEEADRAFARVLAGIERKIEVLVDVELTQGQFDALCCLTYNIGQAALKTSTLLKLLNQGDYEGAHRQFYAWNKNDGVVMRGLIRRQAAVAALFDGCSGTKAIQIGAAAA